MFSFSAEVLYINLFKKKNKRNLTMASKKIFVLYGHVMSPLLSTLIFVLVKNNTNIWYVKNKNEMMFVLENKNCTDDCKDGTTNNSKIL